MILAFACRMLHMKIHRGVMKVRRIFQGPTFSHTCPVRPWGPGTMLRELSPPHMGGRLSRDSGVQLVPFNFIKAKRVNGPEFLKSGGFA